MRLTNSIRSAFVRAAMNDVPSVDYTEQARSHLLKGSIAAMPAAVLKIFKDPNTSAWIATNQITVWFLPIGRDTKNNAYFTVYGDRENPQLTPIIKEAAELLVLGDAQRAAREELKAKLTGVANSVTTRKALVELLPEFEKYLPAEAAKASNLPAISNMMGDFIRAGWPKAKQGAVKAATP